MIARRLASITIAVGATLALGSCSPRISRDLNLPRMSRQVGLRPFEQQMPEMPQGTVPTTGPSELPSETDAAKLTSPVQPTDDVLSDGKRYYGYYCVMCHGDGGEGDGMVGNAYVPKPTDLTSARVRGMTDGELYRAMLTGIGHEPVMQSTVAEDRRWPLVLYLRTLGQPEREDSGRADTDSAHMTD